MERPGKGRVQPASRYPGKVVHQAQRTKRFNQVEPLWVKVHKRVYPQAGHAGSVHSLPAHPKETSTDPAPPAPCVNRPDPPYAGLLLSTDVAAMAVAVGADQFEVRAALIAPGHSLNQVLSQRLIGGNQFGGMKSCSSRKPAQSPPKVVTSSVGRC